MSSNPLDEAVVGRVFEIEYRRAGGTTTVEAVFQGEDTDYEPRHDFATDPPRYVFEDPTRDDRDLAFFPKGLGELGHLYGIYHGEASPDSRALGEVERVVLTDE